MPTANVCENCKRLQQELEDTYAGIKAMKEERNNLRLFPSIGLIVWRKLWSMRLQIKPRCRCHGDRRMKPKVVRC